MRTGASLPGGSENVMQNEFSGKAAMREQDCRQGANKESNQQAVQQKQTGSDAGSGNFPARVRASVVIKRGEYDARRLRSQREVIRDVMLAAADCDTWLTLGELRGLTRYGEASISAQLRHLRKLENGGYDVSKQRREGALATGSSVDGRGECVWEYRILRILQAAQDVRRRAGDFSLILLREKRED
jgi:hypothetical protein